MSFFLKWKAKIGPAKGYPKAVAEWYVKTREKQPNLNVYAIITQALRVNKHSWSLSQRQALRLSTHLKSIAYHSYHPSDYHVLLKFCLELPYTEAHIDRDATPQEERNVLYNAAIEGLNEGLGSFIYEAKSLYTTNSKEGIEYHPISKKTEQDSSISIAGQDEKSGVKEEYIPGLSHDNIQLEETSTVHILYTGSKPKEMTEEGYLLNRSDLAEALIEDFGKSSPFVSDLQHIGRYFDELYPPLNETEFSARNFDLPANHVLFILCFNGNIHSQAIHFSKDTTELVFHIADPRKIMDICLTDQSNDKKCFHLCLSLLNDPDYNDDIRNYIKKGLVPVFFVIAKGDDRMLRVVALSRSQSSNDNSSEPG